MSAREKTPVQIVEAYDRARIRRDREKWVVALQTYVEDGHSINQSYSSSRFRVPVTALQAAVSLLNPNIVDLLLLLGARYSARSMASRIAKAVFAIPNRGAKASIVVNLLKIHYSRVVGQCLVMFIDHFETENIQRFMTRGIRRSIVEKNVRRLMKKAPENSLRGTYILTKAVRCMEPMFVRICLKHNNHLSDGTVSRLFAYIRHALHHSRSNKIKQQFLRVKTQLLKNRAVPTAEIRQCDVCSDTERDVRCNVVQCGPVCATASIMQLFRLIPDLYNSMTPTYKKYIDSLYVCNMADRRYRMCLANRLRREEHNINLRNPETQIISMMRANNIPYRGWHRKVDFQYGLLRDASIWRNKWTRARREGRWQVLYLHNYNEQDDGFNISHTNAKDTPFTEYNVRKWNTSLEYAGVVGGIFSLYLPNSETGHGVAFTVCQGEVLLRNTWHAMRSQQEQLADLGNYSIRKATILIPPF